MFSAVDGFRTTTINVAAGYISTFSSTEIRSVMPDTTGSTLYIGTGTGVSATDLAWLKINNNSGARISGQKKIGDSVNSETGLYATKDSSDNVYLVGQSYANTTYIPGYVAKISNTGAITWQRDFYNGSPASISGQFNNVACENSGGNIYCSGTMVKVIGGTGTGIPSIVKYDSSGALQYQQESSYANSGSLVYNFSRINDLTVDSSGKLYMTGLFQAYDFGNSQYVTSAALQKRYANGAIEWDYTLSSTTGDAFFDQSVVDSSNNVFYSGYYENDSGDFIGKLYSNGVQAWQVAYANADITSICLDNSGNLISTGRLTSDLNTAFYINIDTSNGNINWQNFINSTEGNILINDVNQANGFIYMGGYQQAYTGDYPGFTMKLSDNGNTTGTYGKFTFSTGNITTATSILTATGTAMNFANVSYSNVSGNLAINNSSITRKIIPL